MRRIDFRSRASRHRAAAKRPCGAQFRRRLALYRDVAGHLSALGRGVDARELRLPVAHRRRGDFGEPEIGRAACTLVRFGRDLSVRRDQGKLAVRRLLHREDDTQGRTVPGSDRRGEESESELVLAWGRRIFGPCVRIAGRAANGHRRSATMGSQQQCSTGVSGSMAPVPAPSATTQNYPENEGEKTSNTRLPSAHKALRKEPLGRCCGADRTGRGAWAAPRPSFQNLFRPLRLCECAWISRASRQFSLCGCA